MTAMQAELYNALVAAGAPEEKARAAAEVAVTLPFGETPATSRDIGEVKAEIAELRESTSRDIGELKGALVRLEDRLWKFGWRFGAGIFAAFGAVILLLVKLAFFA